MASGITGIRLVGSSRHPRIIQTWRTGKQGKRRGGSVRERQQGSPKTPKIASGRPQNQRNSLYGGFPRQEGVQQESDPRDPRDLRDLGTPGTQTPQKPQGLQDYRDLRDPTDPKNPRETAGSPRDPQTPAALMMSASMPRVSHQFLTTASQNQQKNRAPKMASGITGIRLVGSSRHPRIIQTWRTGKQGKRRGSSVRELRAPSKPRYSENWGDAIHFTGGATVPVKTQWGPRPARSAGCGPAHLGPKHEHMRSGTNQVETKQVHHRHPTHRKGPGSM